MEKKLFKTKKALKRFICKLQRLNLPHWIQHPKLPRLKPKPLTNNIHYGHQAQTSVSLVYVDHNLYLESSSIHGTRSSYFRIAPERGAAIDDQQSRELEDDHEAHGSLKLHGVDAEAEEFIRKRKEAWMIERQRSVEEFFAMLARGT